MNERELGKALLTLDIAVTPAADPRQLTRSILDRDRRRVRRLAVAVVLFWVLVLAIVGLLTYVFFTELVPRLKAYQTGGAQPAADAPVWIEISKVFAWVVLGCAIVVVVAAVGTVFLVLASRRATLRQINANLVEISEQLKFLRLSPPRPTDTASTA